MVVAAMAADEAAEVGWARVTAGVVQWLERDGCRLDRALRTVCAWHRLHISR